MSFGEASFGEAPFGGSPASASAPVAGDSLRDAFRTRLQTHIANAGIDWSYVDVTNATELPDASTGFIALEFPGADEEQYTFGAPGFNFHRERGQVTLVVCAPLGHQRNTAEIYAEALRDQFRVDRFVAGARTVRITATSAMGGGEDAGGMWVETVGLSYEVFNTG